MTFTKEEARIKIQKLVEDFRAHEATLEHAPEAQIGKISSVFYFEFCLS